MQVFPGCQQLLDAGTMTEVEELIAVECHRPLQAQPGQTCQAPQEGGLAAAVGSLDKQQVAAVDIQVEVLEQRAPTALQAQPANTDKGIGH